jgi:hypothetical protein
MSKRMRGVNLRLESALWNADKSHVGLVELSSLDRYDYTRHGLHINLRCEMKLVQLIANRIRCKLNTGKISVN